MYVEERTNTMQVGKAAEYFRLYESEGMAVQLRHLPHMVGYYVTEIGPQNVVVHMWAYDDLNHYDRCRTAMNADPAWQAYVVKVRALMLTQDTRIMKCPPFFEKRLKKMLAAAT